MTKKPLILAVALLAYAGAFAQRTDHSFLTQDDVPNSRLVLNPPPAERSAQFAYDQYRYFWGRALRETPRGEQARYDCDYTPASIAAGFSPAFGTTIGKEATPELFRLLSFVNDDAGWWGTEHAKVHYKRMRPYIYFGEATCCPGEEKGLADNGSYPSGHTAEGWAWALVLAEINPDNQDTILRRGMAIGESRVICGFHWQSDVDAAFLAGAAVVARLHADEAFQRQLAKAKDEFARLKKQGKVRHQDVAGAKKD